MRGGNATAGHGTSGVVGGAGVPAVVKDGLVGQGTTSVVGGTQQMGGMGITGFYDSSELDMSEIQRLADYDDGELEEWLRDF